MTEPTSRMNQHKAALVPIEAWAYNSPLLRLQGKTSDLGLLSKALLLYEQVYVDIPSTDQLENLVRWYSQHESGIMPLIRLIDEGTIRFHHHAFQAGTARPMDGPGQNKTSIVNLTEVGQDEPDAFATRVLGEANLDFVKSRLREPLRQVIAKSYEESKASQYSIPIQDSTDAVQNTKRCKLLLQSFIDNLYEGLHLKPPDIRCSIEQTDDDTWNVTWNYDVSQIHRLTNGAINFRSDVPIVGEARCNTYIWTAMRLGLDLYLGDVMSTLIESKIRDAGRLVIGDRDLIESIRVNADVPDLRQLVNSGQAGPDDVLALRDKAGPLQAWVQQDGEKDVADLVEAHREVIRPSRLFFSTARASMYVFTALAPWTSVALVPPEAAALQSAGQLLVLALADLISKGSHPQGFHDSDLPGERDPDDP
jgi:hypothetical protein